MRRPSSIFTTRNDALAEKGNGRGGGRRPGRDTATDNLVELGTTEVPEPKSRLHTLVIVGQIEGHITLPAQNKTTKYEHVIPQLVAIEENPDIEGLLVVLNTVGGDVEAGLALAEMIASMSKPTVSLVLGGGHSIGAPVAVAAHYTFIAPTATMTIHPIRMNGLVIGIPQTYEYLDKMQDRVVHFVVNHSGIGENRFRELMFRTGDLARDVGTVLVGRDAVDCGMIREVGGIRQALDKLKRLVDEEHGRSKAAQGPKPAKHARERRPVAARVTRPTRTTEGRRPKGPGPSGPPQPS